MPLRKLLDGMWGELVRANGRCEMCGESKGQMQAHHLISRSILAYRWNLLNGACLCAGCHKFKKTAVHVSPWVFYDSLGVLLDGKRANWFAEHKNRLDEPAPTLAELQDYFKMLDADYFKRFGTRFRKYIKK